MISIRSVNDDSITFDIDGSTFTIIKSPKIKLLNNNGVVIPCPNFNEWFALRSRGFFTANHLYAMAKAFKDGADTNISRSDIDKYVDDIFNLIKMSLFRDGLAAYYIEQYPRCVLSRSEIERLVLSSSNRSDLVSICKTRGYTNLVTRLENDRVVESQHTSVINQIGDVIIKSRIKKYLDERK